MEEMFQESDVDGNRELQWDEFVAMCQHHTTKEGAADVDVADVDFIMMQPEIVDANSESENMPGAKLEVNPAVKKKRPVQRSKCCPCCNNALANMVLLFVVDLLWCCGLARICYDDNATDDDDGDVKDRGATGDEWREEEEEALRLLVITKISLRKAEALQVAMDRTKHAMLLTHISNMCIENHVGAKVAVDLLEMPDGCPPLVGWIEGVDGAGESEAVAELSKDRNNGGVLEDSRYLVVLATECPPHLTPARSISALLSSYVVTCTSSVFTFFSSYIAPRLVACCMVVGARAKACCKRKGSASSVTAPPVADTADEDQPSWASAPINTSSISSTSAPINTEELIEIVGETVNSPVSAAVSAAQPRAAFEEEDWQSPSETIQEAGREKGEPQLSQLSVERATDVTSKVASVSSVHSVPFVRLSVPGTQLAFIQRGPMKFLRHQFGKGWIAAGLDIRDASNPLRGGRGKDQALEAPSRASSSEDGKEPILRGAVLMNWWRWYILSVLLTIKLHHPWVYTRLAFLMPTWHKKLVVEGSRHANVMFTSMDSVRLDKHALLLRKLKTEVAVLDGLEAKAHAKRVTAEHIANEDAKDAEVKVEVATRRRAVGCGSIYLRFRDFTKPLRRAVGRWQIGRKVAATRDTRRQELVDEALLPTMPVEKRKRLESERQMLQEAADWSAEGTWAWLKGVVFSALMMEQKPTEVEASAVEYVAVCACWVYVGFLSYYCMMAVVVLEQNAALGILGVWVASFSLMQLLFSPITLCLTNVLVPMILVAYFVKPWLESRKRRARGRWDTLKFASGYPSRPMDQRLSPGAGTTADAAGAAGAAPSPGGGTDGATTLKQRLKRATDDEEARSKEKQTGEGTSKTAMSFINSSAGPMPTPAMRVDAI
jgi:hypothetical protein